MENTFEISLHSVDEKVSENKENPVDSRKYKCQLDLKVKLIRKNH